MSVSEYLSKIGKRGGLKGGKAPAASLTKKERRARARKAGIASDIARKKRSKAA